MRHFSFQQCKKSLNSLLQYQILADNNKKDICHNNLVSNESTVGSYNMFTPLPRIINIIPNECNSLKMVHGSVTTKHTRYLKIQDKLSHLGSLTIWNQRFFKCCEKNCPWKKYIKKMLKNNLNNGRTWLTDWPACNLPTASPRSCMLRCAILTS